LVPFPSATVDDQSSLSGRLHAAACQIDSTPDRVIDDSVALAAANAHGSEKDRMGGKTDCFLSLFRNPLDAKPVRGTAFTKKIRLLGKPWAGRRHLASVVTTNTITTIRRQVAPQLRPMSVYAKSCPESI
jgi:hypothetical protein